MYEYFPCIDLKLLDFLFCVLLNALNPKTPTPTP